MTDHAATEGGPDPDPRWASLGLLLPGLGHLVRGRYLDGAGLGLLTSLFWAATLGVQGIFPSLPTEGFYRQALLTLLPWAGLALPLWAVAWRFSADPEGRPNMNPEGRAGLYLLSFVTAAVLNRGLLAGPPRLPFAVEGLLPEPPSVVHPLGTAPDGADLLAVLLAAGLPTLQIVLLATAQAAVLALFLRLLPPIRALVESLPALVWILIGAGTADPVLALALTAAPALSRALRSPAAFPSAAAQAAGQIALLRTAFQFLHRDPSLRSWGRLADEGRSWIDSAPWVLLAPSGALLLLCLGFNLLGDGLRPGAMRE